MPAVCRNGPSSHRLSAQQEFSMRAAHADEYGLFPIGEECRRDQKRGRRWDE